jgi:hypothetical protein
MDPRHHRRKWSREHKRTITDIENDLELQDLRWLRERLPEL